jgi:hypothetical protein
METQKCVGNSKFLYGREEISAVLLLDWQQRKRQQWTRVPVEDVFALHNHLEEKRANGSVQLFDEDNLLVIHAPLPKLQTPLSKLHKPLGAVNKLRTMFPVAQMLLQKFHGHLILAGGSILTALNRRCAPRYGQDEEMQIVDEMDADFFFVNVSVERAAHMLEEISIVFSTFVKDNVGASVEKTSENVRRFANECVSTFVHYDKRVNRFVYQFVHRIYPTAMHVIGGFDLGPSMMYYDGTNIYTNAFGAFCLANQVIIGDVSRRSTSYEYRIAKYMRTKYVSLVLCNTSAKKVAQLVVDRFDGFTTMGVIHFMIAKNLEVKIDVREARLAMESGTFSGLVQMLGPREPASDYSVMIELDWRCLDTYNIRAIARGNLNQVTWEYDENHNRVFRPTRFPKHKNFLSSKTCSVRFVHFWWPLRDISHYELIPIINMYRIPGPVIDEMLAELKTNFDLLHSTKDERQIKWITENPGRQWTAAFNPITTADNWYNAQLRNPLKIGICDEVYCLLRCAQSKGYGAFAPKHGARFPRDCFKKILDTVCWLMAEDAEQVCLGYTIVM